MSSQTINKARAVMQPKTMATYICLVIGQRCGELPGPQSSRTT